MIVSSCCCCSSGTPFSKIGVGVSDAPKISFYSENSITWAYSMSLNSVRYTAFGDYEASLLPFVGTVDNLSFSDAEQLFLENVDSIASILSSYSSYRSRSYPTNGCSNFVVEYISTYKDYILSPISGGLIASFRTDWSQKGFYA